MKKVSLVIAIVAILALTAVPALAYNEFPVDDAWHDAGTVSQNGTTIQIQSSAGAGCSPQYTAYVKWDLSSIADGKTVGTANMTFEFTSVTLGSQDSVLSLYQVDNDAWTETNVGTIKPALGAELATINLVASAPPAVGSRISFPSTPELETFLANQIGGDNLASFAMRISACSAGVVNIRFASAENAGNEPTLELLAPNAVEVSSASATPTSWPLYAGLAAVALVVAGGVMISRRKTA